MMNAKAKALLDAHVNFILEELSGNRLKEIIKDELKKLLICKYAVRTTSFSYFRISVLYL